MKNSDYYSLTRRDLVDLLPAVQGRYLEVGCGSGETLSYLKSKGASYVAGIDISTEAISRASASLDSASVANIETDELPFEKDFFDCIILADVLEHLYDPGMALRKLTGYLHADGSFLISVPNVKYYKLLQRLILRDEWTYVEKGILDSTHVRFFTLTEIRRLLRNAGLRVETVQGVHIAGTMFRLLNMLLLNRLKSFSAYQYYLVAKRDHLL